jgi:hypothetical protein
VKGFDWPTLLTGQCQDHTDFFAGEDTALVRPYVPSGEERARRHQPAVSHDLFALDWFASAEAL